MVGSGRACAARPRLDRRARLPTAGCPLPETGAVDAFEVEGPSRCHGRATTRCLSRTALRPPSCRRRSRPPPHRSSRRAGRPGKERPQAAAVTQAETLPAQAEPRPKPAIFAPARPPDDPGVAEVEYRRSAAELARTAKDSANPLILAAWAPRSGFAVPILPVSTGRLDALRQGRQSRNSSVGRAAHSVTRRSLGFDSLVAPLFVGWRRRAQ